jgi:hypothetical protein
MPASWKYLQLLAEYLEASPLNSNALAQDRFYAAQIGSVRNSIRVRQIFEIGSRLPIAIRLKGFAIDRFLRTHRPEMYEAATQDVVRSVLGGTCELADIVKRTALPQSLVEHIGSELARSGDASFEVFLGGGGYITAKPTLRRRSRNDRQR